MRRAPVPRPQQQEDVHIAAAADAGEAAAGSAAAEEGNVPVEKGDILALPGDNPEEGIPGVEDNPGEDIRGAAVEGDTPDKRQQVGHQDQEGRAAFRIEVGTLVLQVELPRTQGEEDNYRPQQGQGQVPRDGRAEDNHEEAQLRDKRRGRQLVHGQERHEERQKDSRAGGIKRRNEQGLVIFASNTSCYPSTVKYIYTTPRAKWFT